MAGHKHRIYCEEARVGEQIELTGDEFHHLVRVIRARAGMGVELFNGKGNRYHGRLLSIEKASATLLTVEEVSHTEEGPSVRIALAWALCKAKAMELIFQKSTELGVAELRPFVASRSVVIPKNNEKSLDRWKKITIEAAKQCGRSRLPLLAAPSSFDEILGAVPGFDCAIMPHTESPAPLKEVLRERPLKSVLLIIGPEGGFTGEEVRQAMEHRVFRVGLGRETLREETACIVTVSAVKYEFPHRDP